MTLQEYDKQLRNHDWYYAWSDDHRVYKAGELAHELLVGARHISGHHAMLFDAYKQHYFSGETFGTPSFTAEELNAVRRELGVA